MTATGSVVDSIPASGGIERLVAQHFALALGLESIEPDEDFFFCGGHSLLATQVVADLAQEFDVALDVSVLFDAPTARELAAAIVATREAGAGPGAAIAGQCRTDGPMSFSQSRLWMLQQIVGEKPFYNVPVGFHLEGTLVIPILEAALTEIVARHEALRTTFPVLGAEAHQHVDPPSAVTLPIVDLSAELDPETAAAAWRDHEARLPFDLAHGPTWRATLIRLAPKNHLLALTFHHIVCDGSSIGILMKEIAELYDAFAHGRHSPLADLPAQYIDFALAQRDLLARHEINEQLEYWRAQLDGAAALELSTDFPREAQRSFQGAQIHFALPPATVASVRALCGAEGVTSFMTLLAAFTALLSRYSGHDDISVGTPIANRTWPEVRRLVGFFVNTLVLRVDSSGDPTFAELVRRVGDVAVGAFRHQDLPFERLAEELESRRAVGRNPFFQVHFQLLHMPLDGIPVGPDLTARFAEGSNGVNPIDLMLHLFEGEETIEGWLEYASDLFEAERIEQMVADFIAAVGACTANPDLLLSDVPLGGRQSRARGTAIATESLGPTLHGPVGGYASTGPDALAVTSATGTISYGELDEAAQCFASELASHGVRRGARVALDLPPSVDLAIAVLGTLRIGATVVPIDQHAPDRWLAQVVAQSEAAAVVTEGLRIAWHSNECVDPREPALLIYRARGAAPGDPVALTHAAVAARLDTRHASWPITSDDRVLWHSSPRSHAWVWECFGPLRAGATLVASNTRDSTELRDELRDGAVTIAHLGASRLSGLIYDTSLIDCASLRRIHCEGDPLPQPVVDALRTQSTARLVHGLGTLEAGGLLLGWECDPDDRRVPPAGVALGDASIEIVDAWGQVVPRGVVGDIRVDGRPIGRQGLMRVSDDAVQLRRMATGDIEVDGCRVDLDALADSLRAHDGVADCAAMCYDLASGERRIAVYVEPSAVTDGSDVGAEIARVAEWQRTFDATLPTGQKSERAAARAADIRELGPAHVFEIGCGTGDLALELASECDEYVACDFSRGFVDRVVDAVTSGGRDNVRVEQREADDFDGLEPASFDVVVLDDVCEYFPSIGYLDRVVRGAVDLVRAGGTVVIGGILDLARHERATDERLWIGRDYFTMAQQETPRIEQIEIREVVPDTYDVFLHVADAGTGPLGLASHRGPIATGLTNDPLARITAARRGKRLARELDSVLGQRLRGVPARVDLITLDRIPRARSGALATAMLPRPKGMRPGLEVAFVAPRTEAEQLVAAAWRDALGMTRVGIDDNFFALGGDSLLALQVAANVRDASNCDVEPGLIFEAPTIAGIVERLEERGWRADGEWEPA